VNSVGIIRMDELKPTVRKHSPLWLTNQLPQVAIDLKALTAIVCDEEPDRGVLGDIRGKFKLHARELISGRGMLLTGHRPAVSHHNVQLR
jgi:hypothetical protein